jgi:uncharacterized membrane protein YdjX (TVP38/TMEM64 family)
MSQGKRMRWLMLGCIMLSFLLVPFFLVGENFEGWTTYILNAAAGHRGWIAVFLGLLLAGDILLPVPSSMVSTAAGFFLGFAGGMLTSLAGMTMSCAAGFWLGARYGRPLTHRMVGAEGIERLEQMQRRFGDGAVVAARAVPVLAEASVLFAGMSKMPVLRFMMLSTLSNLGISAVYAAVGTLSATVNAFLLAVAGSILIPAVTMIFMKRK